MDTQTAALKTMARITSQKMSNLRKMTMCQIMTLSGTVKNYK